MIIEEEMSKKKIIDKKLPDLVDNGGGKSTLYKGDLEKGEYQAKFLKNKVKIQKIEVFG